jgi:predicted transposase/invertase (TIGR01784 family)
MLAKFLNPKNDLAFKRIFGSERNKDILIHFLNDIFSFTTNPIETVTFLKSNQEPEIAAQRMSIVDVLCTDSAGDHFIVEMQIDKEPGFAKRAQYYAAKTYIEQREKGIKYQDLKQVTFLAITDFVLFPGKKTYLCHHAMLDRETREHDLKDFSFSFLELPKFKKKKGELKTPTEKWAYFFKKAEDTLVEDLPLIVGSDNIIQKAFEELDRYSWSAEELRAYNEVDMKKEANKAVLEGTKAEGKAEGKIEVAIALLAKGLDINLISETTGLSLQTLNKLKMK